jgi:hypothetical protein
LTPAGDLILSPAVTLLVFLSAVYTVAGHLVMGLGFKRLLWHWLLAIVGMAAGTVLAVRTNSPLPSLGDAHVIEASIGAFVLLVLAGWRSRGEQPPESPPAR